MYIFICIYKCVYYVYIYIYTLIYILHIYVYIHIIAISSPPHDRPSESLVIWSISFLLLYPDPDLYPSSDK